MNSTKLKGSNILIVSVIQNLNMLIVILFFKLYFSNLIHHMMKTVTLKLSMYLNQVSNKYFKIKKKL